MTKQLYIILFLLISSSTFAQKTEYSFSKNISKSETESIDFIFEAETNFYIVKKQEEKQNSFTLDVVDSNFNVLAQNNIDLPVDYIKYFGVLANELVVFGVSENASSQEDILKAFTLKDFGKSVIEMELLKVKSIGGYHTAFDVAVSPSGNFCTVIGSEAYYEKHTEKIFYKLFDNSLKEIGSQDILTTVESSKRRHNVLMCNDNGYSYIVKKTRIKNANNYFVYTINKAGTVEHADVRLKSRQIVDAEMVLDKKGALYIAGFYSSPIAFNLEGIFITKYEESVKATFSKEYIFNANVIEAFKSKKEIKDYGYGLDYFSAGRLIFIDDKNMILTAEHHTTIKDAKDGPEDYKKGFVVINLDVNGGFRYSSPIITEQNDGLYKGYWSSLALTAENNKLAVYLNRMGEGLKATKGSEQTLTGMPIEKLTFDELGNSTSTFDDFNINLPKYCINTNYINKTAKGILCFESLDRKGYTFGVLNFINE